MTDLLKIKKMWKAEYEQKINSSEVNLWDLISAPSNLELFHPFCKSNKVIKWPGKDINSDVRFYDKIVTNLRSLMLQERF